MPVMRTRGSARELEQRRIIAGRMFHQNKTNTEIAEAVGVTRSAVANWKKWWKEKGMEGLQAKPAGHKQRLITADQKKRLSEYLQQGPAAHGFQQAFWTLALVGELLQKQFNICYQQTQVWRIMHELGFSCQKPKRQALQRDEKAIKRWRTHTWPRLKKGRTRGKNDRVSR